MRSYDKTSGILSIKSGIMKHFLMRLFPLMTIGTLFHVQPLAAQVKPSSDTTIYHIVEQMPQFPGGMEAMQKYLGENVHYPKSAIDSNVQGRVMVAFVVTKTGDIKQVSVIKGVDPALDSEAVRAVRAMPEWEPAVLKGQKVNVYYKVPITFKLTTDVVPSEDSLRHALEPDVMPQFKGGGDALLTYLRNNVRYPKEAIKRKIHGSVIVEFVVDENGNVSDVIPLNRLEGGCTEEALRIIKSTSGKWKSGTKDSKPVKTHFKIPISFRLQ